MNQEIITRIFGNLQGLEKTYERLQTLVPNESPASKEIAKSLSEWEKVLQHMRRTAITMQLQFAKGQFAAVVHSLKIFYGLNQMVRPEVIAAVAALTTPQEATAATNDSPAARENMLH